MQRLKPTWFFSGMAVFLYFINACTPQAAIKKNSGQNQVLQDSIMHVKRDSLNMLWGPGYNQYKLKNWVDAKKYFHKIVLMDFDGIKDARLKKVYNFLSTCYIEMEPANWDSAAWVLRRGIESNQGDAHFIEYTKSLLYYCTDRDSSEHEASQHFESIQR
jgi:hypothetical protein